jgi:hypothetical protein
MWVECSECADVFETHTCPGVCPCCGTAGAMFSLGTLPPGDGMLNAWVEAGLEQASRGSKLHLRLGTALGE